jgi:hypothetical protein
MGTMNYHDAYIHTQEASPLVDVVKALEFLKQQPRVEFNQLNEVFTYVVSIVSSIWSMIEWLISSPN